MYTILTKQDPTLILEVKKYKDQEPPYLMRRICVLQWEEIKQIIQGQNINYKGGGIRYIAIIDMNNYYKTQEYLVLVRKG